MISRDMSTLHDSAQSDNFYDPKTVILKYTYKLEAFDTFKYVLDIPVTNVNVNYENY